MPGTSTPTRRHALSLMVGGAAAAALPKLAGAAEPTFAPGAVIRTILKDYAPAELAGGATLFHEHMSLRDGFLTDWNRFAAEALRVNEVNKMQVFQTSYSQAKHLYKARWTETES